MRIILLTWAAGENDPFSYFNEQFRAQLAALDHEVYIVPLDELTGDTLRAISTIARIDLIFTWQGIGSAIGNEATGRTLWEELDVPLICLHGDHPCYNPANHQQYSRHVLHVYLVESFARDANRLVPREFPALFDALPNFFTAPEQQPAFSGEYFVLPKNFTDPVETRRAWRERCDDATYRLLCDAADAIEQAYRNGSPRDHHDVTLDLLPASIQERVRAGDADRATADLVFRYWRELDHLYRNIASAFVLETLHDVPVHVYGRGWERFEATGNPLHRFQPADRLGSNDLQFGSAWGIIDIAPINKSLHDRTLRAMRRGAGFILSSDWRRGEPIHDQFPDLFYGGTTGELGAKAQHVIEDPSAHRNQVHAFSEAFDAAYQMHDFVERIRLHTIDRGLSLCS